MAKNWWEEYPVAKASEDEWWKNYPEAKPVQPKERTWGEATTDIGASLGVGAGNLLQLPGQLYGLATGDFEDSGILGLGKSLVKSSEAMKSEGLKQREALRSQKIAEADKQGVWEGFKTAFGSTVTDIPLLLSFLAEQAPQLLVPLGAGKAGSAISMGKEIATGVVRKEAGAEAGEAGVKAAIGAAGVQQGADVGAQSYEDIYKYLVTQGTPPEDAKQQALDLARATGAAGTVISILAQRLPGARALEEALVGVPMVKKTVAGIPLTGITGRAANIGKAALGETGSEMVEEGGGKFTQNLAMRDVNPNQSLTEGVGSTAGLAAVGGVGMGGVSGALQKVAPSTTVPESFTPTHTNSSGVPFMHVEGDKYVDEYGNEVERPVSAMKPIDIEKFKEPAVPVSDDETQKLVDEFNRTEEERAAKPVATPIAESVPVAKPVAESTPAVETPQVFTVEDPVAKSGINQSFSTVEEAQAHADTLTSNRNALVDEHQATIDNTTASIDTLKQGLDTEVAKGNYGTPQFLTHENNINTEIGKLSNTIVQEQAEITRLEQPIQVVGTNTPTAKVTPVPAPLEGVTEPVYTPELAAKIKQLRKSLLPTLERFGLKDVGLNIVASIENGTANAHYVEQVMQIAYNANDPMGSLRHESIHALKELGAFTENEWRVLSQRAKDTWVNQFISQKNQAKYKAEYQNYKKTMDGFDAYLQEEAIAEAFRHFANTKPPAGLIGQLYSRLNNMFQSLGNSFKQLGYTNAEAIFQKIERGEAKPKKVEKKVEKVAETVAEKPVKVKKAPEAKKVVEKAPEALKAPEVAEKIAEKPEAHTGTMETNTLLNKQGKEANEEYDNIKDIDKPWAKELVKRFENIQRKVFTSLSAGTINRLASTVVGEKVRVGKIDTQAFGTFDGKASPNMRIPMSYMTEDNVEHNFTKEQAELMLVVLGTNLNQEAQAASLFTPVETGADTFRIRLDNKILNERDAAAFDKAIGYPVNVYQDENGHGIIDINLAGNDPFTSEEALKSAMGKVFPNAEYAFTPCKYESIYITSEQSDYSDKSYKEIVNEWKKGESTGGTRNGLWETFDVDFKPSVTEIRNLATARNKEFKEFAQEARRRQEIEKKVVEPEVKAPVKKSELEAIWNEYRHTALPFSSLSKEDIQVLARVKDKGDEAIDRAVQKIYKAIEQAPTEAEVEAVAAQEIDTKEVAQEEEEAQPEEEEEPQAKTDKAAIKAQKALDKAAVKAQKVLDKAADKIEAKALKLRVKEAVKQAKIDVDNSEVGQALQRVQNADFDLDNKNQIRAFYKKLVKNNILDEGGDTQENLSDKEADANDVLNSIDGELQDAYDNALQERIDEVTEEAEYQTDEASVANQSNPQSVAESLLTKEDTALLEKIGVTQEEIADKAMEILGQAKNVHNIRANTWAKQFGELATQVQALLRRIMNGMMSVVVGINLSVAPPAIQAHTSIYTYTTPIHVANFKGAERTVGVERLLSAILDTNANEDMAFVVADKPTATMYVFDKLGNLKGSSPVLLGVTKGDKNTLSSLSSRANNPLLRTTPSGIYTTKSIKHEQYKKEYGHEWLVQLVETTAGDNSTTAIHGVYVHTPSEQRQARLDSKSIEDNRASWGCLNAPVQFMQDVVQPTFENENGKVFITPEEMGSDPLLGLPAAKTKTVKKLAQSLETESGRLQTSKQEDILATEAPRGRFQFKEELTQPVDIPKNIWNLYVKDKQLYVDYDQDVSNNRHTKVRFTTSWKRLNKAIKEHIGDNENEVLAYHWKLQDYYDKAEAEAPRGRFQFKEEEEYIPATLTEKFKRWFGNSEIVNRDGSPKVMYHATARDITIFTPKQANAIFLTDSPDFAQTFAETSEDYMIAEAKANMSEAELDSLRTKAEKISKKEGTSYADELYALIRDTLPSNQNIMPVYVSAKNVFDFENPAHLYTLEEAGTIPIHTGGRMIKYQNISATEMDRVKIGSWNAIESQEVQAAIKKAGFDGFYVLEGGKKNLGVYTSNQIKSSIGNNGEFDINNPDIRYQFKEDEEFVEPSGKIDNVTYLLQDKFIDLKRVIQSLNKRGKVIADKWNAYLQEELYHGRVSTRIDFFMKRQLNPVLKQMDAAGITVVDMDNYLLARHASEANAHIANVNADPSANAGMTNDEALEYMDAIPANKRQVYERIANQIDSMTKETREMMVSYGLEKQGVIDSWEHAYKHYVPLMREQDESDTGSLSFGTGKGYSVKGKTVKARIGSSKSVVDVLANIALQRERIIARGEKNRVGQSLLGLVLTNPNKDFWVAVNPHIGNKNLTKELTELGLDPSVSQNLGEAPIERVPNAKTGEAQTQINPLWRKQPNVFITRVNGEDRVIIFNMKDPRAKRMAVSFSNLTTQNQSEVLKMEGASGAYWEGITKNVGKGTRYFASINTQYNPAFGLYNLLRDIGGATLNLQSTALKGKEFKVITNALIALRAVYKDLRLQREGKVIAKDPSGKFSWAEKFEEFELAGGKTGFSDLFNNSEEKALKLQKEINSFGKHGVKQTRDAVLGWLSDFNSAIENCIRVSAYNEATKMNLSKDQAASIAKNLTVNFNRTGARTKLFTPLYAFFNASVQGTARIAETMYKDGKLTPAGKKIVAGSVILGVVQAVAIAAAGFDENDPPEWVKDKNIIIPYGNKKYIAIPMPLGFNIFPSFARRVTEFAMSDEKNIGKAAASTFTMILDGFNPLGSGTLMQTALPTLLDPIAAIAENRDFSGRPIARDDMNSLEPTPGYSRAKENASSISTGIAYAINILTGGTEFQKGFISPTPDTLDYLAGQATGGVGREIMKIGKAGTALATGEELSTSNVPVVGRMIGNANQKSAETARFYENIKRLNEHKAEIEGRAKSDQEIDAYMEKHPESALYQEAGKFYKQISDLHKAKKELKLMGADKEDIKALDDAALEYMVVVNEIVRDFKHNN